MQKWLLWTEHLYRLPQAGRAFQELTGKDLCAMSEEDFRQRSPQCGDTLHAHLDIWKSGEGPPVWSGERMCLSSGRNMIAELFFLCRNSPVLFSLFLFSLSLHPLSLSLSLSLSISLCYSPSLSLSLSLSLSVSPPFLSLSPAAWMKERCSVGEAKLTGKDFTFFNFPFSCPPN